MAHPDYIAAAKLSNRTPTVFMKVESADGQTLYYTTQGDWQGSDTLTNIDTTEEPGSVINERFDQDATLLFIGDRGTGFNTENIYAQRYTAAYDQYLNSAIHTVTWRVDTYGNFVNIRAKITDTDPFSTTPSITHYADQVLISPETILPNPAFGSYSERIDLTSIDHKVLSAELWWLSVEIFLGGQWILAGSDVFLQGPVVQHQVDSIKPTSQLKTSAIDFGAVTSTNPIFSVDDITQASAVIDYSYEYSDAGSIYTAGGSIVDGDSLVASRFYKITADFTTSTGGRGKIREFQLEEGLFVFFGSHIDEPFQGVSPQLVPNSVSGFSQKISIGKGLSTTGQSTVKMFWVPETSDLIASGYLRGQDVSIYSGFIGLSTEAYEPVIVGTWFDHNLNEVAGEITVKIQDAFKQFEKRKIPEEVSDPVTGEIVTSSTANDVTFSATSLVTAMKQIFDEIGLRDRYISPDFDTLEAGDYSAAKYNVSRVLHKPVQANKLLDELALTGSMFLIPLGNGQIKPKPFDINQEHVATLDADFIDFVNLEGNLDKFFSRFNSYYNPKTTLTADPTDDRDDYDNGVARLDANAELRWFPEKGIRDYYDKWKVGRVAPATVLTAPPQALLDKNGLDNALLTEPLYTMTAKKLGPKFADIEPADVVAVDNLELPVVDNPWMDAPTYDGKSVQVATVSTPTGLCFSDDGTKFYIMEDTGTESIDQYSMTTPFDVSTASSDAKSLDISGEVSVAYGIWLKPDGTTIYALDVSSNTVYQYTMSTPFDISTAAYDIIFFDFTAQSGAPSGLFIKPDGTKLYIADFASANVYQYTMSTPWDLSTLIYDNVSNSFSSQDAGPVDIFISADGEKLFMSGSITNEVYQYSLGGAFNVNVMTYDGVSLDITSQNNRVFGIFFSTTGTDFFVVGQTGSMVYQYDTPVAFDLDSQSYIEGDRVIHDGKMWRARQDNAGKDPTSEAAFWQDTEITSEGYTNGKHFFVLGRKFNPNDALIELDLMEMPPGTLGAFSAAEFSSAFDIG